jgi:hypothetical protein
MIYGANITINNEFCYTNSAFLPTQQTFAELKFNPDKPFGTQIFVYNFLTFCIFYHFISLQKSTFFEIKKDEESHQFIILIKYC